LIVLRSGQVVANLEGKTNSNPSHIWSCLFQGAVVEAFAAAESHPIWSEGEARAENHIDLRNRYFRMVGRVGLADPEGGDTQ
jgi:hypothetical protein